MTLFVKIYHRQELTHAPNSPDYLYPYLQKVSKSMLCEVKGSIFTDIEFDFRKSPEEGRLTLKYVGSKTWDGKVM